MTPKRKAALQWFHDNPTKLTDRGLSRWPDGAPSQTYLARMHRNHEVEHDGVAWTLTDLGRRRLNGDDV